MTAKEFNQEKRNICPLLRGIREQLGASQPELLMTSVMNMGYTMLSRTENGKRTPSDNQIVQYLHALQIIDKTKLKDCLKQETYQPILPVAKQCVDNIATIYCNIYGPNTPDELKFRNWADNLLA